MTNRLTSRWKAHRRFRLIFSVFVFLILLGLVSFYSYTHFQWLAAKTALREFRLSDAERRLTICQWIWPNDLQVQILSARLARLNGDIPKAEEILNRCLKEQKGATESIQLEFLLLRAQNGEVDIVSNQLFQYVENEHPETELILETIARTYMHHLNYGPAYHCLTRWIQENPTSATPWHWRGWVLERMNKSTSAMEDYQKALELNPDLFAVHLRVAEMWLEDFKATEALPHLEKLQQKHPDRADVMARMGQCLYLLGDPACRKLLESAHQQLPKDIPILLHLAKLESQEGQPAAAEKWLREILTIDATDTEAQHLLANALEAQGRYVESRAAFQIYENTKKRLEEVNKLLREEAEKPTTNPNVTFQIGTLLLQLGQDKLGLNWLHQSLDRDPNHFPSHKALAEYYELKGEVEKATIHRQRLNK